MPFHRLAAVVDLGEVAVVEGAHQRDVPYRVVTPVAERVPVVELEALASGAPPTLLVDVAATAPVALVHGPPDGGRHVA